MSVVHEEVDALRRELTLAGLEKRERDVASFDGVGLFHQLEEAALELHRNLPSLESADHVTNWLRRVTAHRCIDQSRKDRHRPRVALDDIAEPAATAGQDADLFLTERLRKLTASLPSKARAVLLLRYQEDMEPSEIARTLGIPLNTVKSHLQRSLAMLRGKLERMRVSL